MSSENVTEVTAAEVSAETPPLPLKPGPGTKTKPLVSRRAFKKRVKKEIHHGTWKLVYADFVTVLMAFFIVVWVMLFDNIAKRERIDTSCIEPVANELKALIEGDAGLQSGKMPFDIDYSSDGLRITLKDAGDPLFQRGGTVLSDFAKKTISKNCFCSQQMPNAQAKN